MAPRINRPLNLHNIFRPRTNINFSLKKMAGMLLMNQALFGNAVTPLRLISGISIDLKLSQASVESSGEHVRFETDLGS